MNINGLTKEYINKKRYRSFTATRRKLYQSPAAAWIQGWDAAIRFANQVDKAENICEHCGKLILQPEDIRFVIEDMTFCQKCYDKLFKKGGKQ